MQNNSFLLSRMCCGGPPSAPTQAAPRVLPKPMLMDFPSEDECTTEVSVESPRAAARDGIDERATRVLVEPPWAAARDGVDECATKVLVEPRRNTASREGPATGSALFSDAFGSPLPPLCLNPTNCRLLEDSPSEGPRAPLRMLHGLQTPDDGLYTADVIEGASALCRATASSNEALYNDAFDHQSLAKSLNAAVTDGTVAEWLNEFLPKGFPGELTQQRLSHVQRNTPGFEFGDSIGEHDTWPLMQAAIEGKMRAAQLLLTAGSPVDVPSELGGDSHWVTDTHYDTPLMWAASRGDDFMCELLLHHGANPTRYDVNGATAVELARDAADNYLRPDVTCPAAGDPARCKKLLIAAEAEFSQGDYYGDPGAWAQCSCEHHRWSSEECTTDADPTDEDEWEEPARVHYMDMVRLHDHLKRYLRASATSPFLADWSPSQRLAARNEERTLRVSPLVPAAQECAARKKQRTLSPSPLVSAAPPTIPPGFEEQIWPSEALIALGEQIWPPAEPASKTPTAVDLEEGEIAEDR